VGSPPEARPLPVLDPASELGRLWAGRGAPEYSQFTEPASAYYERYLSAIAAWKGVKDMDIASEVWTNQVMAAWGLLARGAESLPFAMQLIRHQHEDAREQGAFILGYLGKDQAIVDQLLKMLDTEIDDVVRDSVIIALGQMRSKLAIATLAKILRDPNANFDTRWTAGESLGRIVHRRFGKAGGSVLDEAIKWLDAHHQ
jgi:HEAT repeat protein